MDKSEFTIFTTVNEHQQDLKSTRFCLIEGDDLKPRGARVIRKIASQELKASAPKMRFPSGTEAVAIITWLIDRGIVLRDPIVIFIEGSDGTFLVKTWNKDVRFYVYDSSQDDKEEGGWFYHCLFLSVVCE